MQMIEDPQCVFCTFFIILSYRYLFCTTRDVSVGSFILISVLSACVTVLITRVDLVQTFANFTDHNQDTPWYKEYHGMAQEALHGVRGLMYSGLDYCRRFSQ